LPTAEQPTILHVRDHLRMGGAEQMLVGLVRELDRAGRVRSVVCVATAQGAHPRLVADLRRHAARVRALGRKRLPDPRLLTDLVAVGRAECVALVHSHPGTTNGHARLAAVALGVPHVTTVHTAPGPLIEDRRRSVAVDRLTARLSTAIVAPSPSIADAWSASGAVPAGRLRVVPNVPAEQPVQRPDARSVVRARENVNHSACLVLCVARLQPAKGIVDLIAVAGLLRSRLRDLRVLVAGEGPQRAMLDRTIADEGLGDTVRLLGQRDDVAGLLAAADAFCLPSHHEGLPVSLLEAMGSGVPSVACAVGGIPDLIDHGRTGLLAPAGRPEELAAALGVVLADRACGRRLGDAGRELVERRHAPAHAAARYAELYRELIDRRG
jgi:glycosyltransferase involved in cell wall biosynthesis